MTTIRCDNCQRLRTDFIRTAKGPGWCLDCAERFGSLSARIEAARRRRAQAGKSTVNETASTSGSSPGDFLRNELNTNRKEIIS